MKLLIIDFDQTVADTSHLAHLRSAKKWDDVLNRGKGLKPFDGIPQLTGIAKRHGLQIAVVTSLPNSVAERLIAETGISFDHFIGSNSTPYPKPSFGPMKKALDASGVQPWDAVAIGDRCIDTEAARRARIDLTLGALWGLGDEEAKRELGLSFPKYLAPSPASASEILDALCTDRLQATTGTLAQKFGLNGHATLWLPGKRDKRTRGNLDSKINYNFCRYRYNGPWNTCLANCLVTDLKKKPSQITSNFHKRLKEDACRRFSEELLEFLPDGAFIAFIPTSKKSDDPEFDSRNEIIWKHLELGSPSKAKRIQRIEPVIASASHQGVHEMEDSADARKPANLARFMTFAGFPSASPRKIYVIDDVLTSGGHMSAFALKIWEKHPEIELEGVFWTAHVHGHHPSHGPEIDIFEEFDDLDVPF